jgi:hypothetical protein
VRHEAEGTLTARDGKTHVALEVVVPRGAARLGVCLRFARGEGLGNMLCLSLFDSRGFRGSGHRGGALHQVSLSTEGATPGYLPGPIPPGKVRIVIHAHRIVPGEACPYELEVEWSGEYPAAPRTPERPRDARRAPGGAPGWYRGDLHAHTVHSDGDWCIPELLSGARGAGLDFVALTEHNTTSQVACVEAPPIAAPLVISGMELTTFRGHALSLGTREWIDWGVVERGRAMPDIAADVARKGGFFVIAHPCSVGDPACTGCDWRYEDMMPGSAPAVEIWNGPWGGDSNNEKALALWYAWLDRGHRLVATAGSDAHELGGLGAGVGFNVVGAESLAEAAILRAVQRGRLYLSSGPRLELEASSGAASAGMGETLAARSADISLRWRLCPAAAVVRLVGEGGVLAVREAAAEGADRWRGLEARWLVAELRDPSGQLLAVTNPVYLEG